MAPTAKGRPLIGILTTANRQGGFSGNRQNFQDLTVASYRLGGLVFVFTPEGIDEKRRRIHGFRYSPQKRRWLKVEMPFPDVVYNRIPRRADEHRPHVQQAKERLQRQYGIPLFNPSFFNKWDLYQWLHSKPELAPHLPMTARFSFSSLQEMARQFDAVYLKPIHGKAGIHFYKIVRLPSGFQLTHQLYGHRKRTVVPNWGTLRHYLAPVLKKPYIIQQAIPLATFQGRPFDLRLLVQKNGSGQWAISGIGARMAGPQAITTHVPQGGTIIHPETALNACFGPQKTAQIFESVRRLAIQIAQALEHQYGLLGELSMDIGIDRSGHPWFFEANAKPMKFDEPHIRKMSIRRFFEYCHYLSQTKKKEISA